MTMTTKDTILAPDAGTLAALRALAVEPFHSATDMRRATDHQARLLGNLLPAPVTAIPAHLAALIPSVRVDYIDTMPVPGTALWSSGHWHIHIRASDPEDAQVFTVLHGLKHIIDHPLRRQLNALHASEWEALADYFARQVLAREPSQDATLGERRNSL